MQTAGASWGIPRWQAAALALLVGSGLLAWDFAQRASPPPPARATWPAQSQLPAAVQGVDATHLRWVPRDAGQLPMPPSVPSAHASFLLPMPAGHACAVMAFWFAGERESAPDVRIAQSCFQRSAQAWSPAQIVLDRHDIGPQLGFALRRLGNPVAWLDAQGRTHLFVVATGPGGWAASRILHVRSEPGGLEFGQPRVLPLSWWWNLSFLVRGAPLPLEDGGFVLPVYFELGGKTPFALRFDAAAHLLGTERMSERRGILQPTLIPLNARHWMALMRDNRIDGKVAATQSGDGGAHWRDLRDLNLSNPDAAIAALPVGPWHALLVHNSSAKSRRELTLSESGNGLDWSRLHVLASGTEVEDELGQRGAEFSYPSIALADGTLWVTYTEHRRRIAWQRLEVRVDAGTARGAP